MIRFDGRADRSSSNNGPVTIKVQSATACYYSLSLLAVLTKGIHTNCIV